MLKHMKILKLNRRFTALLLLGLLAALLIGPALDARAQEGGSNLFLPLVTRQQPVAVRIGYGVTTASDGSDPSNIAEYAEAPSLGAGWYLNWGTNPNPARPEGIQYAQMIRVHQTKSCGERYRDYDNRVDCPLLDTYSTISGAQLAKIAENKPGALYLIGNEIERVDWGNDGQDENTPEVYAVAYHDLHTQIKALDPTAKVAIGGVIQVTELRLEWIQRAWDEYKRLYNEPMPVDVWNAHFFAIREMSNSWGADIPAGLIDLERRYLPNEEDRQSGQYTEFADRAKHGDVEELKRQAYRFREFMADLEPSQQNKPLIVTEYGLLYNNVTICQGYRVANGLQGNCSANESTNRPELPNLKWHEMDQDAPVEYMIDSFDFFLNEKNCDLGYAADDCRLVQKWNWYSLDDKSGIFNEYTKLIDPQTGEITNTGRAFRDWVNANFNELTHIGGW